MFLFYIGVCTRRLLALGMPRLLTWAFRRLRSSTAFLFSRLLRGPDSNRRPQGYEPCELTAAPPRDNCVNEL